jgi:hypothetical protein
MSLRNSQPQRMCIDRGQRVVDRLMGRSGAPPRDACVNSPQRPSRIAGRRIAMTMLQVWIRGGRIAHSTWFLFEASRRGNATGVESSINEGSMPTRKAHARWEKSLKEGKGQVDFGNVTHSGFIQHANAAKAGCPVSQALAGIEITLDAKLAEA